MLIIIIAIGFALGFGCKAMIEEAEQREEQDVRRVEALAEEHAQATYDRYSARVLAAYHAEQRELSERGE